MLLEKQTRLRTTMETSWETWNVPLVPVRTGPGILSGCAVKGLEEAGSAHVVASQILLQPQRELV